MRLPSLAQAVLWSAASAITFAASSAAAKFLGQKLPAAELSFFRAAFGALLLVGVWRFVADLGKARDPWGYVLRCGLGVTALYSLMYAFTVLPLALASLLFITRVLLLPVAARLMLGERSGPLTWATVGVGFIGAALPLLPALAIPEQRWGVVAAVVASFTSAGSQTAVRRLTEAGNAPALIVLIYTTASVAATFPVALPVWVTPPVADWPVLCVLGIFAVIAQVTAAKAFALAPVSFLAPLDFLSVPAAAAIGFAIFGEVPSAMTIIGAGVVLASNAALSIPILSQKFEKIIKV